MEKGMEKESRRQKTIVGFQRRKRNGQDFRCFLTSVTVKYLPPTGERQKAKGNGKESFKLYFVAYI